MKVFRISFCILLMYLQEFTQESDGLWKDHCCRDFKGQKPDEFESWRELYLVRPRIIVRLNE